MLAEALKTVARNRPDAVILVDDGSDFDAPALAREYVDLEAWALAPKLTPAERIHAPRLGTLLAEALFAVGTTHVAYLCDDDLWADGWLDRARAHYDAHPDAGLVRGDWLVFRDGEPPTTDDPPCALDARGMTTGNFCHPGHWPPYWSPRTISSHDDVFLWHVQKAGIDTFHVPNLGLAGWRREHPYNAINFSVEHGYTAEAVEVFERGWLE
jgi:glycosyltransferase involved in cell wall biosynthesis